MFNITKEELAEGVRIADEGAEVFHFKNAVSENPSWDEFFEHLDYEAHNKSFNAPPVGDPFSERAVNAVTVKNLFYLVAFLTDRSKIHNLEEFSAFATDALGTNTAPVTSFVTLISGDQADPHHDCRKTLFWQCQGTTKFQHLKSDQRSEQAVPGNVIKEYVLEPGDLFYLAWEVPHNVFVTGPRAGITFDVYENNMEAHPYPGQALPR